MLFEYMGFMVYRLEICRYMVIGPGFRGYAKDESEARQIINIITAGQCGE
jgi:hypothetical protein